MSGLDRLKADGWAPFPIEDLASSTDDTLFQLRSLHIEKPDWVVARNGVGNFAIFDEDGTYVGWVDFTQGEVRMVDQPDE